MGLYAVLVAGALLMIAVSRWPWWQLHAGRPKPACLFSSGPGTLSRQLPSPALIMPSCPPRCPATPSQPLHNTSSTVPQCTPRWWRSTYTLPSYGKGDYTATSLSLLPKYNVQHFVPAIIHHLLQLLQIWIIILISSPHSASNNILLVPY